MPNSNLVPPLTSFIGRAQELTEIRTLLQHTRLLTLTGVGGCGKTRLAIQLATEFLATESYFDGIWWIDLVGLNDPGLLPNVVAKTLGVHEAPDTVAVIETLRTYLSTKQLLFVLDNCEHLLLACGRFVQNLLSACPNIQILATSREALGLAGELSWLVPSLSLPEYRPSTSSNLITAQSVDQNDAVRLFVERVLLIRPGFKLTDDNAKSVALICKRLDGLPLAIELAAARVNVLSVRQIADRLDDCFAILTAGNRTALIPRHETLRATLDWSFDLLSEPERILFRRLSVFSGDFAIDAVENICIDPDVASKKILDLLSHLIDKSLVIVDARESNNMVRYRLLETIRQYANMRLIESGENESLHQRYAFFFVELAEKAKPELTGPNQKFWFERLNQEQDNFRSSLSWLLQNDVEAAAQMASGLFWFWHTYGYWSEGRAWYDRLLKQDSRGSLLLSVSSKAQALFEAGWLAIDVLDTNRSEPLSERSLALFRQTGDKRGTAEALIALAWTAYYRSDYSKARNLAEESLALFKEVEFKPRIENVLKLLGNIANVQGLYEQANVFYKESLRWSRETGDKPAIAYALSFCGYLAWLQADLEQASKFSEEALQLAREAPIEWAAADTLNILGDIARVRGEYQDASRLYDECDEIWERLGRPAQRGFLLWSRGWLARAQGSHSQAIEYFIEGLSLWKEMGEKRHIAECLEGLAGVGLDLGKAKLSARLMGMAEKIRETMHSPLPPIDRAAHQLDVMAIRSHLGESSFTKMWEAGRILTLEQSIDEALQITANQEELTSLKAKSATPQHQLLNERELEILSLVAQGASNQEISQKLILAVSTVKWYINILFEKLDVHSRTQAVARARELGLL